MKNRFGDVKVPIDVLDKLDQGINPQVYTGECLKETLNKNKGVNGKIELYKKLHAKLLEELGEEMPAETALYRQNRNLRTNESPN